MLGYGCRHCRGDCICRRNHRWWNRHWQSTAGISCRRSCDMALSANACLHSARRWRRRGRGCGGAIRREALALQILSIVPGSQLAVEDRLLALEETRNTGGIPALLGIQSQVECTKPLLQTRTFWYGPHHLPPALNSARALTELSSEMAPRLQRWRRCAQLLVLQLFLYLRLIRCARRKTSCPCRLADCWLSGRVCNNGTYWQCCGSWC
mmetsp:Transcript_26886/g.67741  ORF Transcript_26886/g.67741 Transcript_26886/m.67741 type:complete len:209 (-) Transcript_26886:831-1457(-)